MCSEHSQSWIQTHYKSFDGLRGLAILMVFCCHYGAFFLPQFVARQFWCGVDLFFVLSGFLITGILYDSRTRPDYFRNFYTRRSLRIFPLYFGLFAVLLLLRHHLVYDRYVWLHLVYLANFAWIKVASHNFTVVGFRGYAHMHLWLGALWSLCVEEQFYLVWPLLLWRLGSRRAMMQLCVVAIAATLLLRTVLFAIKPHLAMETHYLYFATYSHGDGLFVGSWMALWLRGTKLTRHQVRQFGVRAIAGSFAIVLTGILIVGLRWPLNEANPVFSTIGYTCVAVAAGGLLLLALDDTHWISAVLRFGQLAALGEVSYGFYVFHGLVAPEFQILSARWPGRHVDPLVGVLAFVMIYACSRASYRWFEKPFIGLKDVLAPKQPGHRALTNLVPQLSSREASILQAGPTDT